MAKANLPWDQPQGRTGVAHDGIGAGLVLAVNAGFGAVDQSNAKALVSTAGAVSRVATPMGLAFGGFSATAYLSFANPSQIYGASSFFAVLQNTSTADQGFCTLDSTGASNTQEHMPYGGVVYSSALSQGRYVVGASIPGGSSTLLRPATYVATRSTSISGSTYPQFNQYINASRIGGSTTGAVDATPGATFRIGQNVASGLYYIGNVAMFAMWNRELSVNEVELLHENPWRIFYKRRIWTPVSVGGGGTVSLTVADALHAHAADNVVLTSQTAITIADALHAHAADNVVLTAQTAITIADALHAHAVDNVVLTSQTAITIADALHAHAADNVVLTSQTAITIADALHAHAADNVVLQIAGATNLTVADALHAHASDNVVLTSQIAIVVADATHAHTVDGLTLTVTSVLALQDALHAHAADNLTLELSGGITLTLADALHAHTADGVLLTVSAYLVVSDARHAHAADNILLSIPGAFRAGNPRVWILDSRQRYSMVDSRRRVVHLN